MNDLTFEAVVLHPETVVRSSHWVKPLGLEESFKINQHHEGG